MKERRDSGDLRGAGIPGGGSFQPAGKRSLVDSTTTAAAGPGAAAHVQRSAASAPIASSSETQGLSEKAASIKRSVAAGGTAWSRQVVDVFEQTEPTARIALQRELDMDSIVSAMPDFEATRLGTLGPLTAGQAVLNQWRIREIHIQDMAVARWPRHVVVPGPLLCRRRSPSMSCTLHHRTDRKPTGLCRD